MARRTKPRRAPAGSLSARISAGDFQEVLTALLGKDAPNLSPAVIAGSRRWKTSISVAKARFVGTPLRLRVGDGVICRRGWSHKPNACWY